MAEKEQALEVEGVVTQALANTLFIVASAVLLHEIVRSLPAVRPWALHAAFAYALCTPILYSAGVEIGRAHV